MDKNSELEREYFSFPLRRFDTLSADQAARLAEAIPTNCGISSCLSSYRNGIHPSPTCIMSKSGLGALGVNGRVATEVVRNSTWFGGRS